VRRTGQDSGAARSTSGGKVSGGRREPSRRPEESKPDHISQPISAAAGSAAGDLAAAAAPAAIAAEPAPGLYLVATPIGNLGDVTLRALAVLRGVDRILCEDTRITARLLARYGIAKPLSRYDDHNAAAARPAILAALRSGERLALVSDAGTPLVSDPGYKLVQAAIAENLPVSAVPGPSAALTALILSGLPPDAFWFEGFLPSRGAARRRRLEGLATLDGTLIFFESAGRLADSLADMADLLGDRKAAVARELTKLHEEVRRGPLDELACHYRATGPPRGEAVVIIGPPERPPIEDDAEIEGRLRAALAEVGVREAATKLAADSGLPRRELYRRALAIAAGKR
jgi:16S rRNA (cytidine1402-2'-O)-methyltransferase